LSTRGISRLRRTQGQTPTYKPLHANREPEIRCAELCQSGFEIEQTGQVCLGEDA